MGLAHIISSCMALLFGTLVLVMKKGSRNHIRAGYAYVGSMGIMLLSSALITNLYGGFGPFHVATIISTMVTALGMISIITKKPRNSWKFMHFNYMYWSVIGLYIALVAELLTRVPETPFYGMVFLSMILVTGIGWYFFQQKKEKWKKIMRI